MRGWQKSCINLHSEKPCASEVQENWHCKISSIKHLLDRKVRPQKEFEKTCCANSRIRTTVQFYQTPAKHIAKKMDTFLLNILHIRRISHVAPANSNAHANMEARIQYMTLCSWPEDEDHNSDPRITATQEKPKRSPSDDKHEDRDPKRGPSCTPDVPRMPYECFHQKGDPSSDPKIM